MKSSPLKHLAVLHVVMILALGLISAAPVSGGAHHSQPAVRLIIDADIGVDDAAAIAYLLDKEDKVEILGITTVAGNTAVENSANNALLLLETAGRTDIPVVIGAPAPLVLSPSLQGMFIHGPDGLWFTGWSYPQDLSGLSTDAAAFLCDNAAADVTLLAQGPLTNVANAVQQCPAEMSLYRIVWLGGAKIVQGDGNTPVSEFNSWFDPDATQIVLEANLNLTMVPLDAARTVAVPVHMIDKLDERGNALGQLLAPALQQYASLFATTPEGRGAKPQVVFFDPVAAAVAIHPEWATSTQSALVLVQTPDGPARGQTIMALTVPEHISVLATDAELSAIAAQVFSDPEFNLDAALGEILFRRPDNAQVVFKVNSKKIAADWLSALMR
jgi:purine nucleosidase